MSLRYLGKGEITNDTNRYARFATHLNSKKAGPLVCPICNATESFEAKGTLAGAPPDPLAATDVPVSADPLAPPEPRFNSAACPNCGYSIFFDAEISDRPG